MMRFLALLRIGSVKWGILGGLQGQRQPENAFNGCLAWRQCVLVHFQAAFGHDFSAKSLSVKIAFLFLGATR